MYGLLHEPFWSSYGALLWRHGLTSYTLLKWKLVSGGGLGPVASSALVGVVFLTAAVVTRPVWSRRSARGAAADDGMPSV